MARKSVNFATSLKRFQRKITSQNSSSKGSDGCENTQENHESNNEEDLQKVKLVLQNESLVKTNSCLSAKVKELEKTIKDMFEENSGQRRINDNIVDKKLLEKRLNEMESCLVENYNNEFNNLQRMRQDFNISLSKNNSQIKSIAATDHTFYLPSPIIPTCNRNNNSDIKLRRSSSSEPPTATVEAAQEIQINKPNTTKNISISAKSPDVSIILEESEKEDSREIESNAIGNNSTDLASDMDISQLSSLKGQSSPKKIATGKPFQIYQDTDLEKRPKAEQSRGENKLQQNTRSQQEDPENVSHRPKRNRKTINYKPIPLGAKLRRESSTFVDAVDENAFNFAVSGSKRPVKRRKLSSSQPLTDSTNVIVNSQDSSKESRMNSELSIFDFEDDTVSKPNKSRRQTFNI